MSFRVDSYLAFLAIFVVLEPTNIQILGTEMATSIVLWLYIWSLMCELYLPSLIIFVVLEPASICKYGEEKATKTGRFIYYVPSDVINIFLLCQFCCPRNSQY